VQRAVPRLHLRAGEQRSADRVAGQHQPRAQPVAGGRDQLVPPGAQPADQADQPAVGPQPEPRGHVPAAQADPHPGELVRPYTGHRDDRVPAGDQVGPAGQHLDAQLVAEPAVRRHRTGGRRGGRDGRGGEHGGRQRDEPDRPGPPTPPVPVVLTSLS
jgi:hypothetical protein